jgi:hypothetical protein
MRKRPRLTLKLTLSAESAMKAFPVDSSDPPGKVEKRNSLTLP